MKRAISLGSVLVAVALAACQQTVVLDDLSADASRTGTGGTSGGGGKGGFTPSDASTDGRCFPGPTLHYTADVPQVVLILDRSTTMNQTFGTNGQTPITVALSAILAEISYYGGGHGGAPSIDFAAFIDFPDDTAFDCNATTGCCPSDYTTNYSNFELQAGACSASGPNQCFQSSRRPTAAALNEALTYFSSGPAPQHNGERYVLLITNDDPDPSCSNNACTDAIRAVDTLSGLGATTEIIALGSGSGCLDDLANAQHVGATPLYPTTTPPTNLPDVIKSVLDDEIAPDGCRLTLTTPPTSGQISVYFNNTRYSQDPGTTGDGWNYDGNLRVYLHGSLCNHYLNPDNMFEQLTIYDGCGSDHSGQTP